MANQKPTKTAIYVCVAAVALNMGLAALWFVQQHWVSAWIWTGATACWVGTTVLKIQTWRCRMQTYEIRQRLDRQFGGVR